RLIVEAKPGTGRVLVDINQLLFWVDTQNSIRVAQKVAQNYTKTDLSSIDLVYAIETNASIIGGPSAGAAITIATIALIENKTLNQSVMMTGTINSDGTIGPVGEIVAKAKAAKDVGAKLFLVPKGQSVQVYYKPIEHCERFGPITYCSTEYKPEKIDVSKEVGIAVKEVSNIREALKYFLI
ncbi:MAG: ATP-dependent protease, partial [Candidatus Aenigmarchaeota archaeon]|nr:ATP-dependent protease [Candidatus Aenigmarchaeota archaeon]